MHKELVGELDRDSEAAGARAVSEGDHGGICSGCLALAERVERLEEVVARQGLRVSVPILGTTACYWIVIAIHSILFAIMTAGVESLGTLIYAFLTGSIGSLTVCHVFAVRSFTHKLVRTLLSVTVVSLAASIPFVLQLEGDFSDLFLMLLLYLPPCIFSAWFMLKIVAWTRGWRIVPPGSDGTKPPMKIREIFGLTLIVAVYLGACRVLIDFEEFDFSDGDILVMLAYIAVASFFGAVPAALLARGVLVASQKIRIRWAVASFILLTTTIICMTAFFLVQNGDSVQRQQLFIYGAYAVFAALLCALSPVITFLLMRSAGYYILYPGSTRP